MNIQVLGSGCATCKKLYELVTEVAKELHLKNEVEYMVGAEGIEKMIALGALGSPAIAIDGAIVMTGFTNEKNKIKGLIQSKIK